MIDKKIIFYLNLTYSCNFTCTYCLKEQIHSSNNILNIDDLIIFIENNNIINKFNIITFIYFGGEPLIDYNNIFIPIHTRLHDYFINKSVKVLYNIATNGYFLNKDILDFYKKQYDLGDIIGITLALDGTEKTHLINRHESLNDTESYKVIINNLRNFLIENDHMFTFSAVINDSNIDDIFYTYHYLTNILPARKVSIRLDDNISYLSDDHLNLFYEYINTIGNLMYCNPLEHFDHYVYRSLVMYYQTEILGILGYFGTCLKCHEYHVSPTGLISKCILCDHSSMIIGTLLDKINLDSKLVEFVDKLQNINIDKECLSCNYFNFCCTDFCYYNNYILSEDLNSTIKLKNTLKCTLTKFLYDFAKSLYNRAISEDNKLFLKYLFEIWGNLYLLKDKQNIYNLDGDYCG